MCLQRLHLQQYDPILNQIINGIYLTNRPQFSMVYTLIDHINDVIKCSKLKWNHEPHVTCYVISMVYTLIDHSSRPISARGFTQLLWKSWFLIITLFFSHLDLLAFGLSASIVVTIATILSLFKFVFLDPTSYQHRSVLQTYLWKKKPYHSRRKVGQSWPCVFSLLSTHDLNSILHIACDELLEIGINLFFGIGNYDVIQNHVVAFLVDTSDHSSTNQLSLKFVKMCQRK